MHFFKNIIPYKLLFLKRVEFYGKIIPEQPKQNLLNPEI